MDIREHVRKHLVNHAVIFGDNIQGKRWQYFIDIRQALLTGGMLAYAGELIWDKIKKYQPEILVGQGIGAMNLLIATQIAAEKQNYKVNTLVSREARKMRQRHRLVEGPRPKHGARAIFVDDSMVMGSTYAKLKENLKEEGIEIDICAAVIFYDFYRQYGSRRLEILGLPIERIFTRHDLGLTRIDPKNRPIEKQLVWRNLSYAQWAEKKYVQCPPTIYNEFVLFATDNHEVFCHRLNDGELIWSWQGSKPTMEKGIGSQLVIANNRVYFSSYDGNSYCLDLSTGLEIWAMRLDMFLHSTPYVNVESRELYLGTEGGLQYTRGDIVCQDIDTGLVKWRFPTRHVIPASACFFNNQVICCSNDGYIYSITDGKLNWSKFIGISKGRPASYNNSLFVVTEDGKLLAIDSLGNILWERGCGVKTIHQFLQIHPNGLLFIGNQEGSVIAFDSLGNQIWIRVIRGSAWFNLKLYKDELAVITQNGYAVILNALTGQKNSQSWLKYPVQSPPDFNDDYFVVHSADQGLLVYRRQTYDIPSTRASLDYVNYAG